MQQWRNGVRLPLKNRGRSKAEWAFVAAVVPLIALFYTIYKWPTLLGAHDGSFYLFGKSPGFYYSLVYTTLVCTVAASVLLKGRNVYRTAKKPFPLSRYQRAKFVSIFFVQLVAFFLLPFVIGPLLAGQNLLHDPIHLPKRDFQVYVAPAFKSVGSAVYVFLVVPLAVYFFGKRYCSWFCSCGNLSETVGTTKWGAGWVRHRTPRGPVAKQLEVIQAAMLVFALVFGVFIVLDAWKVAVAGTLVQALQATQNVVVDFLFGSVVGVAAYPFLGTRVWCRFGCPLAKGMQLAGGLVRSRFKVVPNERCKGLNLCTQACPMGIDVAAFAHEKRAPLEHAFGLPQTPCIGCGGCIEICPRDALRFAPIGRGPKPEE